VTRDALDDLNLRLDHAALRPDLSEQDIVTACREAREYKLRGLVVNPFRIKLTAELLAGSPVRPISVTGFPLGAGRTEVKLAEAVRAGDDGAAEIDMVANIGWIVEGRYAEMQSEICIIRSELPEEIGLKVIIETALLTPEQQIDATKVVADSGGQFVKTSTGFYGGPTIQQVKRLARVSQGILEVKASGGIKSLQQCRELLEAGATCLGTSSSAAIMREMADFSGR
jgi:deoxyribose-phosphate aldolase